MSFLLTQHAIKSMCGPAAFDEGERVLRAGQVMFTHRDAGAALFEAEVQGALATCRIVGGGEVLAQCTCSSRPSPGRYCPHVAAVLLALFEEERTGRRPGRSYASLLYPEGERPPMPELPDDPDADGEAANRPAPDARLTSAMLGLFAEAAPLSPNRSRPLLFDSRTALEAEFICKPVASPGGTYLLGIEMRIGPKRLYIVPEIRELLARFELGRGYDCSRYFAYEPELHRFRPEDEAVMRQLLQIVHHETLYREAPGRTASRSRAAGSGRLLPVPPLAWEPLLPLLAAAPAVRLELNGTAYDGIRLSDEPLPLRFQLGKAADDGLRLEIDGLDKLVVLEPYGMALAEGKLVKLPPEDARRLAELKRLMEELPRRRQLRIAPEQEAPFVERAVPGLAKLGTVQLAESAAGWILRKPLQARLYLDRLKDRLLAGLEFQYGDIVINPLEEASRQRGADRIVMRDADRERRILELMEEGGFIRTESGYFMEGEEAEYDFLVYVLPRLQELLEVHATSAVKARLHPGPASVKAIADVDERTDWLEVRFDIDGIPEAEIRKLLRALEDKSKYYRLPGGALMNLDRPDFREIAQMMESAGIRSSDVQGGGVRLPAIRGLLLADMQGQGGAIALSKPLRRMLEHLRNPDHLDFPVPERLAGVLRDYQTYGFQWMKTLARYRFGGILADDMGLGKTIQSIAFLVSVLPEIRERGMPALIVCPASLMYNWRNELQRFAPQVKAVIADGSKAERIAALRDALASRADVVIVSYPLLRMDAALYAAQPFHTLILDEAQAFKNDSTQTAKTVKALQAAHRFALTGTPLENSLGELWSIFDAVIPGLFPDQRTFASWPRDVIARRIRPFLLRRRKSDVLKELPEKIESIHAAELLPEQKKLYAAYLAKLRKEALKHLNDDTFEKNRLKILAGLTRLRQLCCHPALFVEGYEGGSAKLEQLMDIVEQAGSAGKRLLVFSQFTTMLELIRRELGWRGVPFFYLDGSTPAAERVELCQRFNDGERDVFLISLKAGGTGLNLTGADTVVLYDLWWNPAVEEQAESRAHRIGQRSAVQVIRLIAQGTLEEKMYELQQKKKRLIDEVIESGGEASAALSEQELRELLMI